MPVAVEPVNVIMSTRGSAASAAGTSLSLEVTTLKTPAGKSVFSLTRRPSSVPAHGVSCAGLSTTVLPAASAGTDSAMFRYSGGVPRRDRTDDADGLVGDDVLGGLAQTRCGVGLLHVLEVQQVVRPVLDLLDGELELDVVGHHDRRAERSVTRMRRNRSFSSMIASRSWRRQRARSSGLRDQSVVSKARTGRRDRLLHVLDGAVGALAGDLAGGPG